ncbi:MAG TPA: hypothetical protein VLO12_07955 [Halomonas sp.]|nr:hypothetical protein [Halomonas sp.]
MSEGSALEYRPGDQLRRQEARRAAKREKRRDRRWVKERFPWDH